MENFDFETEIVKRYGQIRRARGNFLYTQKNVRLLDLYLDNGAAILGWSKGQSRLMLKNTLERGFSASFSFDISKNLMQALKQLFNLENFDILKIYSSEEKLKTAFEIYKNFCDKKNIQIEENLPIYRPFFNFNGTNEIENFSCFSFVLPFSWNGATLFACKSQNCKDLFLNLPQSDAINKPLEAAFCRSIFDLIAEQKVRTIENYAQYDAILEKFWNRSGAYLFPKVKKENYKDFFIDCLENRVLISPFYQKPSIVPYGVSAGSLNTLKTLSFWV